MSALDGANKNFFTGKPFGLWGFDKNLQRFLIFILEVYTNYAFEVSSKSPEPKINK